MVATDLPTHTQVVTNVEAFLALPLASNYADALYSALLDPVEASKRATAARNVIHTKYNRLNFDKTLLEFYSQI
jgi:hypothetical protein